MNSIFKFFRESYFARFLIPIGIILIVMSVLFFIFVDNTKDFIKTDAVVSKIELEENAYDDAEGTHHDATYNVFVKYTIDNIEYENEFGIYSHLKVGDKVKICYNKNNPNDIAQPTGVLLPIILLIGGIASIVGGIVSIVVAVKKHKKLKDQEKEWKTNGN